jgi:integrase
LAKCHGRNGSAQNWPDTVPLDIGHARSGFRSYPKPEIDRNDFGAFHAGFERRHGFHQHVLAPPSQLRHRDALFSWPVLPKRRWPAVQHKERRAITFEEHQKIIERERNPEIRAYYQFLWHLGGSQTAELTAEDIDWKDHTISYQRRKTGVPVIITFGAEAESLLQTLPKFGPLFPRMARIKENHRAKMFIKRLKTVGITGISMHSYRYAWAERARTVGMPERFAQQALGHSSKAFARAYSKKAKVIVPSLEAYESKIVSLAMAVNQ